MCSSDSHTSIITFLAFIDFYLKARIAKRGNEGERFSLHLFTPPNSNNGQNSAHPKPAASRFLCVSHMEGKGPGAWTIFHSFPRHISKSLDKTQRLQDLNQHSPSLLKVTTSRVIHQRQTKPSINPHFHTSVQACTANHTSCRAQGITQGRQNFF